MLLVASSVCCPVTVHVWGSEGTSGKFISFHLSVGSGIRFMSGGRCLYLLSRPSGPGHTLRRLG